MEFKKFFDEVCEKENIVELIEEYGKTHKNMGFLITNDDSRNKKTFFESKAKFNRVFVNIAIKNKTERVVKFNSEIRNFLFHGELPAYNISYGGDDDVSLINPAEDTFEVDSPYATEAEHMKSVNEIIERMGIKYLEKKIRPIRYDLTKALLYNRFKHIQFDMIDPLEYEYLNNVRNPFIYLCEKKVEIKTGYQYDLNSHFGSILRSIKFIFPLKKGVPMFVEKAEDIDTKKHAMYMLDVDYSNFPYMHNKNADKYYYSNYDVEMFREAGIQFEVRSPKAGESHNALFYSRDCLISGKQMFRPIIDELYDMKKTENKTAGQILRMLHGVMSEKKFDRINREDYRPEMFDRLVKFDGDKIVLLKENAKSIYKCGLARIKGFLYSYIRLDFYRRFIKGRDGSEYKIFRIYIDSVIIDKKLDDDEISDEIGDMKYEGMYEKVVWNAVNRKPI